MIALTLITVLCIVMIAIAQTGPHEEGKTTSSLSNEGEQEVLNNTPLSTKNETLYVEGELNVRFDPEIFLTQNARDIASMKAHSRIGSVLIHQYDQIPGPQLVPGLQLIQLPPGMQVADGIAYYQNISGVMYAEPNAIYTIQNTPVGNVSKSPGPAKNQTNGDIFVRYNATAFPSPATLQVYANATNSAINSTVIIDYTPYGMPGLQLVHLALNMTIEEGIAYYQDRPYVLYAEPNTPVQIATNQTINQTLNLVK